VGFVNDTVRALTLNGIYPTFETVNSGAYPLGRDLYLLSRNRPTGVSARVIDFIRSAQGQEAVADAGFLTLR
jgi:phosphate transport system substrate-binding protein